MKNTTYLALLALVTVAFSFGSCTKDKCEREVTYVEQIPVYEAPSSYRADISAEAARELKNPGKIYFYNDYILINEQREGIHLIDNADPTNPVQLAFLPIPGNIDMAVRGNILYADNYTDLVAIDMSDPQNPFLANRNEDVFPHFGESNNGERLVYYQREVKTETVECQATNRFVDEVLARPNVLSADVSSAFNRGGAAQSVGVGGSMARFTITDDHLYTIDQSTLRVFDLSNPTQPDFISEMGVGWDIETIFPYNDMLFIGSTTGMFIFDNSTPSAPTWMSSLSHATGCDPVFVKDNYAYVTLHSGTLCNGENINQLDLVDITDPRNPILKETFPMQHPHGLSIKEDLLFLCEGRHGLKVFDITVPEELDDNQLSHRRDGAAYDVIVVPGQKNVLLLIGEDGFYQYNFDDPRDLQLLSNIPVKR